MTDMLINTEELAQGFAYIRDKTGRITGTAVLEDGPCGPYLPLAPISPEPLRPVHIQLLKRGTTGRFIWLSDAAELHTGEVVALGQLHRMGFVEEDAEPPIPGPPCLPMYTITDAGRSALNAAEPK